MTSLSLFLSRAGARLLTTLPLLCLLALPAQAEPEWKLTKAELDADKPGPDGQPSLRIAPGGKAVLPLGDKDSSGKVTLHVWDDGTVSVPGKGRGVGPRWGLTSENRRVMVAGVIYAPYLPEGGAQCLIDADPEQGGAWFNLKYLGGRPKTPKWQKWVFDFDAEKGLSISIDGKAVPERRFDWNATKIDGMNGVVIYGDETGQPNAQDLWVGGIAAETGPEMKVKPAGVKPPEPVVPDSDPAVEGGVLQLKPELRGTHPRLLVTKEQLPALREFYNSEAGRVWREKIIAYLPPSTPPDHTKFLRDATDGQRQGLWRLPTVALHAMLTGDETSISRTKGFLEKLLELPHWEEGGERDSGMSAANIMIGAALAYDWIHDELDPDFRAKFREKLLLHARTMYYGGHLKRNPGTHYWQNDPANNHRWHRNAGLVLSILAIYENRPEEQWILQRAIEDLEFVAKWLPHDGSCHEGPNYFLFGGNHLTLALDAADTALGTEFLQTEYYKRMGEFRMYTLLPGMGGVFSFGDGSTYGLGGYHNFLLRAANFHGQSDIKDGLYRLQEKNPKANMFGWFSLIWDDPNVPRGDMTRLPTAALFEDVGYATMRDSWRDDAVAASFICGPFGGHDLLKFTEGGKKYINVAHDDPDALEFLIAKGGDVIVETDGYSKRKASRNHNTILVNGFGQMTQGRPEGGVWAQPGGDMTKMAYVTAWKTGDNFTAIEGEASGSYLKYNDRKTGGGRPQMDRVRRSFLWVEGDYILVLDDIRAPEAVEISWLIQSPEMNATAEPEGRFLLKKDQSALPMQIVATQPLATEIRESPADHQGKSLGLRQLVATANTSALRVASIYDPWDRGGLTVTLTTEGPDKAVVVVKGDGIEDQWTWEAAKDNHSVSTLTGQRLQGPKEGFPLTLGADDFQPLP